MSHNIAKKYSCESCDYHTSNIFDFNKHKTTRKHIKSTTIDDFSTQSVTYSCDKCNACYKERSGLWRHKKQCSQLSKNNVSTEPAFENSFVLAQREQLAQQEPPEPFDFSVMFELIKQNQEFKELLVEQNKQMLELAGKIGNTNNTQNIKNQNNNNQFNIQMFLNEKCKDAISLDDFVESLQFNTQTAEYAGKHGFVNGITNIFMTGLKQLEVHQRPFHCTDAKRETLYVKRIDMWAKDGETNPTMLNAINDVSTKNMRQMPRWIEENPECQHSGTDKFEEQLRIMHGMLNTPSNKELVLKKLAKEAFIDKANHS